MRLHTREMATAMTAITIAHVNTMVVIVVERVPRAQHSTSTVNNVHAWTPRRKVNPKAKHVQEFALPVVRSRAMATVTTATTIVGANMMAVIAVARAAKANK